MTGAEAGQATWKKPLGVLLAGLLFFGALISSVAAESSPGARRYLMDIWRSDRGLPQNTITGVAQTPDGYLWVSTLDGLARFDGARFKLFKAGNTPELGSGRIRFLFTGRAGALWICTQEGEVIKFQKGRFVPLPLPEHKGIRPATVQVAEDDAGGIWLSGEDGHVSRLAGGKWKLVSTNWTQASRSGFQARADREGKIWVIGDTGLYKVVDEKLVPVLHGKTGEYVVLCPGRDGGWWIRNSGQIRLWRDEQWLGTALTGTNAALEMRSSLEDRAGHLWLGSWGGGLVGCGSKDGPLRLTRQDGLAGDFVRVLFEDNNGDLWAGTEGGGLCRLHLPLFARYGLAPGLSWEWITSVAQGPDGKLWVGTDGYGLNVLHGQTIEPVSDDPNLSPLHVMAAIADRQGTVWVGARAGSLFRWQNGRMSRVNEFAENTLATRSLYEDSHGAIWIGLRNTTRVPRIRDGKAIYINLPESVGPVDIRVMVEDARGAMWFGTDGNGLLCWKDGRFSRFTRENGLGSDYIWALSPEPNGTLWIGTFGGGVTRLKDGRMTTCTTREGLVDDVICHIADDGRGQLWFSSHQGVFRASKKDLNLFADGVYGTVNCVPYGKAEGLPTLECKGGYQPAGCRSQDGRLWFATIAGIVAIDPSDVSTNIGAPPVYVDEVLVNGKAMDPRKRGASVGETGVRRAAFQSPPSSLEVPAGKNRFEFRYAGLSLNAPDGLRFRHKLEGVDADWVETGQRQASYNNLERGAYTFRVQAGNREGIWNTRGDAITFTVLPFFWQTWWFDSLVLATFGTAVAWVVGLSLRRRHERDLVLLQKVHAAEQERSRIARDIHDDLGSSLTEISLIGALALRESTPSAEAREQVSRMVARTEELTRKLDETVWAVNPKNDSLKHLATYLCNLAKEFLEPTPIRCRLDVASDLPDVPLNAETRHNLYLAAKEAIHNAVRHSGAKEIQLRLNVEGGVFQLEISDDGLGFVAEASREKGNGQQNMANRMNEIGGEFELNTAPGRGTTVRLHLPLHVSGIRRDI